MSRTRRNLTLSLLISGFLLSAPARAVGPQFSLSLDLIGHGLFSPIGENLHGGYGGSAFFDIRPFQVVSAGFGFEYLYFPGVSGVGPWKLSTFTFGGRIFPMEATESSEFYLQGGIGLNLLTHALYGSMPEHFYGTVGFGYRNMLKPHLALDLGAQYNFYSPLSRPLESVGIKLGFAWIFGTTQWPGPEVSTYGTMPKGVLWRKVRLYAWQTGDNLRGVSDKLYGESDLYSLLVDANRDNIPEPRGLTSGVTLRVPELPPSLGELDAYRDLSLKDKSYLRWANLTEAAGYRWGDQWKGPSSYIWRKHDSLLLVAEKLYGDEQMFPLLVDANEERLIHPASLVPGVKLIVPRPETDKVEEIRAKAQGDPYIWWKNASERP
jgi:nucleoid-associated protein YgaU